MPLTDQPVLADLHAFVRGHPRLLVLTGAGISTDSGIPGYRDAQGNWQRTPPVQAQDFFRSHAVRQRYWARSMLGWPVLANAQPNAAHFALAQLQTAGYLRQLVTQNVDGLHQRAGSTGVIELHGHVGSVICLACGTRRARASLQSQLEAENPDLAALRALPASDGDAHLELASFEAVRIPACGHCGGVLKPDVVFFGESVPRERVDASMLALTQADALLVIGSSLTVFSGYRFCLAAGKLGKPVAAINLGQTRADALLALKVDVSCAAALTDLVARLDLPAGAPGY
ncbi:NAD-dependent deacetylase [Cupriavidus sp. SK-3]|nr:MULTISPECIES: NAD-dependent protein deacetylase [Cupriavidus]KDP89054.1 NAD-dependent deacetylase [Cupriavidus sp. SK-3]MDF3882305.1 NAD-dependent protein deacetylase [Cupriavidus basilensis]